MTGVIASEQMKVAGVGSSRSVMPRRLLLDTDIGTDVDDAIALALLLASPELDLCAITCVSGDTERRAQIAARFLQVGKRPAVRGAAGGREPLLRQRSFLWAGHEGNGILDAGGEPPVAAAHAVDLLIETVLRQPTQIVAIGPLTNLAVAIIKEPAVIDAIPQLTIMGGAVGITAEIPSFEYNLASDPEATVVVLNSGIPIRLVPLDVTWWVRLQEDDLQRLQQSGSALVQTLAAAIAIWAPIQRSFFSVLPSFTAATVSILHDPLTLATAIEPSLVTWQRQRLRAVIEAGLLRLVEDATAAEVEVAVAVDAERARTFVTERLLRLA